VNEENLHIVTPKMREPVEKLTLSGVGGKTVYREDPGPDRNIFVEEMNLFCTVNDLPSRRSLRLEAYKDDARTFPPYIVTEVVFNPPRISHAARGNHYRRTVKTVYGH
jgi:hypothetical protein